MGISDLNFSATNVRTGLEADLPAYCSIGDEYNATDTEEKHVCFAVDTWTSIKFVPTEANIEAAHPRAVLPAGMITMWYGLLNAVPIGWKACDGANGTPDLRNKFVRGAAAGADSGAIGGADTHTLTTAELAAHSHSFSHGTANSENPKLVVVQDAVSPVGLSTGTTGGGTAHNNIPAYYALVYIMKV